MLEPGTSGAHIGELGTCKIRELSVGLAEKVELWPVACSKREMKTGPAPQVCRPGHGARPGAARRRIGRLLHCRARCARRRIGHMQKSKGVQCRTRHACRRIGHVQESKDVCCRTRHARRRIGHLRIARIENSAHNAFRRTGARCRTRYARRRIGRLHRRKTRHARWRNGRLR